MYQFLAFRVEIDIDLMIAYLSITLDLEASPYNRA